MFISFIAAFLLVLWKKSLQMLMCISMDKEEGGREQCLAPINCFWLQWSFSLLNDKRGRCSHSTESTVNCHLICKNERENISIKFSEWKPRKKCNKNAAQLEANSNFSMKQFKFWIFVTQTFSSFAFASLPSEEIPTTRRWQTVNEAEFISFDEP